jgi:hypothetical protein
MPVMAVNKFKQFFRRAAELDVDKNDLKRYDDFVFQKIYDLLLIGQATAKANGRDIVEAQDLPVTKGLQESIYAFRKLDHDIELQPILTQLTSWPPLELTLSDEAAGRLPAVAGGLSVALARTFKLIDPDVKNPQTAHWERAFQIFALLL